MTSLQHAHEAAHVDEEAIEVLHELHPVPALETQRKRRRRQLAERRHEALSGGGVRLRRQQFVHVRLVAFL